MRRVLTLLALIVPWLAIGTLGTMLVGFMTNQEEPASVALAIALVVALIALAFGQGFLFGGAFSVRRNVDHGYVLGYMEAHAEVANLVNEASRENKTGMQFLGSLARAIQFRAQHDIRFKDVEVHTFSVGPDDE